MMTRRQATQGILATAAMPVAAASQRPQWRELSAPQRQGGMPLMSALNLRCSARQYSGRALPLHTLSNLLWAAFGINRPGGDRTAPYWRHVMVMDIYAAMADGVWLYEPQGHALHRRIDDDICALTGLQDIVGTAPLNLIYVAHGERMTEISPEDRRLYASVDTGFISQNVYLFCASQGLATVFRGAVDGAKLGRTLNPHT